MSAPTIALVALVLLGLGFALPVLLGLVTGRVNTKGLLRDGQDRFSPARLQGLIVTLGFAVAYVATVAAEPASDRLPDIPAEVLLVLAGSGGFFLASKRVGGLGWLVDLLRRPR